MGRFLTDTGDETRRVAGRKDRIPQPCPCTVAPIDNKGFIRKSLQREGSVGTAFSLGKPVSNGQRHNHWLLCQWMNDKPL